MGIAAHKRGSTLCRNQQITFPVVVAIIIIVIVGDSFLSL